MRAEFLAISAGFNRLPRLTTTGVFDTVLNQVGSYAFTLPPGPGTLALLTDAASAAATAVGLEATRATAAETALATAVGAEATARAAALGAETARAVLAEAALGGAAQPRLGFTPVQQGTGIGQLANLVKIGWTGTGLACTVDASDEGLIVTTNTPHGFAQAASVSAETARALAAEAVSAGLIRNEANARAGANAALAASIATKQPNLGFTPVQQGTGIGQLANVVKIGWTAQGLACTVDATSVGLFVTTSNPQGFALAASVAAETTRATAAEAVSVGLVSSEANARASGDAILAAAVGGKQAALGFVPVRQGFGADVVYIGWSGSILQAQVNQTVFGQIPTQAAPGNFIRNGDNAAIGTLATQNSVVSNGDVLASAAATGSGLYLRGSATTRILNWSADGWKLFWNASTGTLAQFSSGGAALLALDASGNLSVVGNVSSANVSDARTKRAITPYRSGLACVIGLEPIAYEYNGLGGTADTGKTRWGVSAQQARPFLPECVYETPEPAADPTLGHEPAKTRFPGQLSFDEQPLLYAMVNAFRDVAAELLDVQARLAMLEAR